MRYGSGWGAVNAAAAVGQVDYMGDKEGARGLHFGVHLNVSDATKVMGLLNMTKGFDGWLLGAGRAGAVVDDGKGGKLQLQDSMDGFVGISHRFSGTVRAGLCYGWLDHEDAQGAVGGADKEVRTVHATVWWSPMLQANIGLELRQSSTHTTQRRRPPRKGPPASNSASSTHSRVCPDGGRPAAAGGRPPPSALTALSPSHPEVPAAVTAGQSPGPLQDPRHSTGPARNCYRSRPVPR